MKRKNMVIPVIQYAGKEKWFQDCWRSTSDAEIKFAAVRDTLTAEQLEILDDYLAAREKLASAMVSVAYEMGQSTEK